MSSTSCWGKTKAGNGWEFEVDHDQANGHFMDAAHLQENRRNHVFDWLAGLPVVLERPDLRVVHAC